MTSRHSRVTHPTHFTSFTSYSPVLVAHGLLTCKQVKSDKSVRVKSRAQNIELLKFARKLRSAKNRRLTRYSPAEVIHGSLTQDLAFTPLTRYSPAEVIHGSLTQGFALRRSRVTHPFRSLASYSPAEAVHGALTHSSRSRVTHPRQNTPRAREVFCVDAGGVTARHCSRRGRPSPLGALSRRWSIRRLDSTA